ncbi:MAG: hypothetical protein R6X02_06725 [Enhygromyxa sp.]
MTGWRRFERGSRDGVGDQFWAVRVRDRVCEIRRGYTDFDDEVIEEAREYPRASQARGAANQKIRGRLQRGWVEVEVREPERVRERDQALAKGEVLELAVAAEPDNRDAWAVYADFLQGIDPVLGERIALGLALERAESEPERERLRAEIDALEREHDRELFGVTLAGIRKGWRYDFTLALERRFGMITGVELEDAGCDIFKFDAVARALLDLPLARVLLDLELASCVETLEFMRTVALLLDRPRPTVRRLSLGHPTYVPQTYSFRHPPIQALLDVFPNLESLALYGPFEGVATHPKLRELRLGRPGRRRPKFQLAGWRMPTLRSLAIVDPSAIEWPKAGFPALARLWIDVLEPSRELIACIAWMPGLDGLDELVLFDLDLTLAVARALLRHADALAGPRRFVLVHLGHVDDLEGGVDLNELRERLPNLEIRADVTGS